MGVVCFVPRVFEGGKDGRRILVAEEKMALCFVGFEF
jgi:hypothetical protein